MNNSRRAVSGRVRRHFDAGESFMTGHQILVRRQHDREIPEWAKNDTRIQTILLRSFPKLAEKGSKDAVRAGRWARVIQLYFRLKRTHGQVAEEMGMSYGAVRSLIRGIKRVSEGKRYDGRGMLGEHPVGRPRKLTPQPEPLLGEDVSQG